MIQSITFITDWQKEDYYLGALKGSIISYCNSVPQFVDISHQITQYQFQEAAFVLRNSYYFFPKGSIHVITVNNRNENPVSFVAVKFNDHYFLSPDSGVLNLLVQNDLYEAVLMENRDHAYPTFPELAYISRGVCHIMNNKEIQGLGESYKLKEIYYVRPQFEPNQIIGNITYIDGFGNIITNISRKKFEESAKGRSFSILIKGKPHGIERIHNNYCEDTNELIAVFNTTGLLEIAQINYAAYKSLGLRIGDRIKITFR